MSDTQSEQHYECMNRFIELANTLKDEGKVQFSVEVTLRDEAGDPVVEMSVDWYLSPAR